MDCMLDFPTCARIFPIDWSYLVESIECRASSAAPGHPKLGAKFGAANLVDGASYPVGDSGLPLGHVVRSSDPDLYHDCASSVCGEPLTSEHGVLRGCTVERDVDLKRGRDDPREFLGSEPGVQDEKSPVESAVALNSHKARMSVAERRRLRKQELAAANGGGGAKAVEEMKQLEALMGYEAFHKLPPGSATIQQVVRSSAGIEG